MKKDYAYLSNWLNLAREQRQEVIQELYDTNSPELREALLTLIKGPPGFGLYASMGPLYSWAIFGRDSIVMASNLLPTNPELAREIILLLAALQGVTTNLQTEEEPGKIHHEYRATHFNGDAVPEAQVEILQKLAAAWGGTKDEFCYYGSHDATPLFVTLVGDYCARYGPDILEALLVGRDGRQLPLRDHVRQATLWLVDKIQASPWRLFEYKRLNPQGLPNQAWEDSSTAYLHLDGTVANADGGIAAVELQGYAYDALVLAADLVANDKAEAASWRELASLLQRQTLRSFWMPEAQYFAMGVDRDSSGQPRHIATLSSNAAFLLGSRLLADLPYEQAKPYVKSVVKMIMGADFLTNAGVRLRARRHADLLSYADYHGSSVTWPRATHCVAQSLHAHGLHADARALEDRILHAVLAAGEFYEFFFVTAQREVRYHYRHQVALERLLDGRAVVNSPEPGQGWTLSAVFSILDRRHQSAKT